MLDDHTLLIPDRPGNRRVDTMMNIAANPYLGLLFMVPGVDETLRVNGAARYTQDADLLFPLSANGKPPLAGICVTTEEVFFHCGKALMRSHLWSPQAKIERRSFPSLGKILADQIQDTTVGESERFIEESYTKRLY